MEDGLQVLVVAQAVSFPQIVAAIWAGKDLCLEGTLDATLIKRGLKRNRNIDILN